MNLLYSVKCQSCGVFFVLLRYGFVTFSNQSEVQRVLQASEEELILDGRLVIRPDRL